LQKNSLRLNEQNATARKTRLITETCMTVATIYIRLSISFSHELRYTGPPRPY